MIHITLHPYWSFLSNHSVSFLSSVLATEGKVVQKLRSRGMKESSKCKKYVVFFFLGGGCGTVRGFCSVCRIFRDQDFNERRRKMP